MEQCIICSNKYIKYNICDGCNCFTCHNCKVIVNSFILCQMCHYDYEKAILHD